MIEPVSRRAALRQGALLAAGTVLAACSLPDGPSANRPTSTPTPAPTPTPTPTSDPTGATSTSRTLLVYFSRAGENYYYGGRRDLEVGNTEVLARMINELIDADVHRIEAADPYPEEYDATVQRNVREQGGDERPAIANPLDSISPYDTVLVGSPIWNVRPPMIMNTFAEGHDFGGLTDPSLRHPCRQRSRPHSRRVRRRLPRCPDRPWSGRPGRRSHRPTQRRAGVAPPCGPDPLTDPTTRPERQEALMQTRKLGPWRYPRSATAVWG